MSKPASKKLVVCGGNGFLGSRICKYAADRGWNVTSISRSGQPKWAAITSSSTPPSWASKVQWEAADAFNPSTYRPLLKDADYVVQSMGTLLETDYKGIVNGTESPISALQKAIAASGGGKNPLEQDGPEKKSKNRFTYELVNRDAAVQLAREASEQGAGAFLYVSAAGGAPILPARYIESKRAAESIIASDFPRMRSIAIRPAFLYDNSRLFTIPLAGMTAASAMFNNLTGGVFRNFLGAMAEKPLAVDVVAEAAVEALSDETVKGPVEVPELEALANKGWRKGML